ncbi:FYN-binding protein-like isoform X2 [Sinocyclocheilus anshuiensis]|uniref:FYN-binding protein-like isoform X2 n=1 Tax=Sinocyclocheilus anshuiensis TaxID=1608454 RepID=UPI0007BAC28E|nr:PREDICTED: FYN-binding protein-like isoform X2 [Sinocyclocheilus anshuiensis]
MENSERDLPNSVTQPNHATAIERHTNHENCMTKYNPQRWPLTLMEDNKSDVKAIMALFQAGSVSTEGTPGVRPKPPVQPTLSSGPAVPAKKPVLETSLSSGVTTTSTAPKPKNTVNTARSAPDMHEPPKLKAVGTRFENTQENNKVNFKVPVKPKPPDSSQDHETPKVPFPKAPLQKPPSSIMANDSKPMAPTTKPSWIKDTQKAEDNSTNPTPTPPKKPLAPKPKSNMAMLRQQPEESSNMESPAKPSSVSNVKPSSFRVKNSFNKPEEGAKVPSANESVSKLVVPNKPNFPRKSSGPRVQTANDDPSAPKKKPLPNSYALGNAPAKPNRPPKVNLEKFKKGLEVTTDSPGPKNVTPPPPPASHPSSQAPPPLPSQSLRPNLPPRPPGPIIQDENYDDVDSLRAGQINEGSGSDGEIYEDLDDSRSAAELSQPQKKQDKELKIQKDRDKKEKDAIKKFKISTPLQVIHQVKAKADCKGGKHDLSIKKGESIDIIRITDNPEGKWLGRGQDGSFGYVKTEMVEIDFSVLKNKSLSLPHNLESEEVYDDIESMEDQGNMNGQWVVLPPPPDDDVYDDIPEPNLNPISIGDPRSLLIPRNFLDILKSSVDRRKSQVHNNDIPPPPQFTPEDVSQDIYDDVDSFPPAPSPSSLPQLKSKAIKVHEDPKKQKKFEKEEKEFRKKFKYDGEIQVLHQATIATSKKGSGKDLTVQAGETVDVINKSDPDKFICRNKEGKFGYVSTSNIQTDDEVYDDIGDDCIYDND